MNFLQIHQFFAEDPEDLSTIATLHTGMEYTIQYQIYTGRLVVLFGPLPEGSATLTVKATDTKSRQLHYSCKELDTAISFYQTSKTGGDLGVDQSMDTLESGKPSPYGLPLDQPAGIHKLNCTAIVSPLCVAITDDSTVVEITVSPVCAGTHSSARQDIFFTVSAPEEPSWITIDPILGMCVPSIGSDAASTVCDETILTVNGRGLEPGSIYSTEIMVDFQDPDKSIDDIFKYSSTLTVLQKVTADVLNSTTLKDGMLDIAVAVNAPPELAPISESSQIWGLLLGLSAFQCSHTQASSELFPHTINKAISFILSTVAIPKSAHLSSFLKTIFYSTKYRWTSIAFQELYSK